uniref:Uncharacterized protein n=1 Tax=Aegilops tauschii subsp. strangulata TaxID=200361 RepID=A0A453F689_AEGTS
MKPFEHKSFYGRTFMGFGVLNGISIWLLNQSLCFNSVGFYQGKSSALVGSRFLILHRTCQKCSVFKGREKNVMMQRGQHLEGSNVLILSL